MTRRSPRRSVLARRLTVAGATLLVGLTGCGGADVTAPAAEVHGTDDGSSPPEAIVTPRPGMVDLEPVWLWFEYAWADEEDTLLVTFGSQGPPCEVLGHVETEESDAGVTVTLYEGRDPEADPDEPCDGPKDRVLAVEVPLERAYEFGYVAVTNGGSETDAPDHWDDGEG
jgi:hypothetical protein